MKVSDPYGDVVRADDDARQRDGIVGNAHAPLPEPWFIREARERSATRSTAVPDPVVAPPPLTEAGPAWVRVEPVAPPAAKPWRVAVIVAVGIVAALVIGLMLLPKQGGAPPVAALPEDGAVAAAPIAVLDCASPAAIARLRDIIVGQARAAGGSSADSLDARAAGLSVSVAAMPDTQNGDGRTLMCRGLLSLPQTGDAAPLAANVLYRLRPAAGATVDVLGVTGATPIVQALARPPLLAAEPDAATAPQFAEPEPAPPAPQAEPAPPAAVLPRAAAARPAAAPRAVTTRTTTSAQAPARETVAAAPPPVVRPRAVQPPAAPRPAPVEDFADARPSFNCRGVTSRVLQAICSSPRLAALDVEMSELFYSVRADADREARAELEDSRADFIARRQSCRDNGCIARAYRDRIAELDAFR